MKIGKIVKMVNMFKLVKIAKVAKLGKIAKSGLVGTQPLSEEQIEVLFGEADTDGDGTISCEEYLAFKEKKTRENNASRKLAKARRLELGLTRRLHGKTTMGKTPKEGKKPKTTRGKKHKKQEDPGRWTRGAGDGPVARQPYVSTYWGTMRAPVPAP